MKLRQVFTGLASGEKDPCSIANLTIQNNVQNIVATDMGDIDDYDPGF